MQLYALRKPEFPWGDYGSILLNGMGCHLPRKNGLLQLERTGPFVPPISFPWTPVVTDSLKRQLEGTGLTGLNFQPVIKAHVVPLNWTEWDLEAEDPAEYPAEGEPENYILAIPHSPELAEAMPELWELAAAPHAKSGRESNSWSTVVYIVGSTWDGTDFFKAEGLGYTFISQRAKDWLEREVGQWVYCEPFDIR